MGNKSSNKYVKKNWFSENSIKYREKIIMLQKSQYKFTLELCLPTTSKSLVSTNVWKDGASAETSQLYFPYVPGWTEANVTWLSLDNERWKKRKRKNVANKNCKSSICFVLL